MGAVPFQAAYSMEMTAIIPTKSIVEVLCELGPREVLGHSEVVVDRPPIERPVPTDHKHRSSLRSD